MPCCISQPARARLILSVRSAEAYGTGRLNRDITVCQRRWPRRLQELFLEVAHAVEELTHEQRKSPTIKEIAERVGVPSEDVIEALEVRSAQTIGSLDTSSDPDEDTVVQVGSLDPALATVETAHALGRLLRRLPERDQVIIHLRFVDDLTQSEIAAKTGVSQMQVSRILARSLAQLREWGQELSAH